MNLFQELIFLIMLLDIKQTNIVTQSLVHIILYPYNGPLFSSLLISSGSHNK
jgi:hypothetical protein